MDVWTHSSIRKKGDRFITQARRGVWGHSYLAEAARAIRAKILTATPPDTRHDTCRQGSKLIAGLFLSVGICIGLSTPRSASGYQVDKEAALKRLDETISKARAYINEPDTLVGYLFDNLRPLGDDPRVLSFYIEVIDKSTNTLSIHHAVGALGSIAPYYSEDKSRMVKIESAVLKSAHMGDEQLQLDSADVLAKLGAQYVRKAHQEYRKILSAKYKPKDERSHKVNCSYAIQSFLRYPPLDAEDIRAIQKATKELDLLEFYKRELAKETSAKWSQHVESQWLDVMNSKAGIKP